MGDMPNKPRRRRQPGGSRGEILDDFEERLSAIEKELRELGSSGVGI
jgi:hypothetical protein